MAKHQALAPETAGTNLAAEEPLDMTQLPQILKQTRKARGLTLAEVSQQTGLTISTLSRLENGLFKPKTESFLSLLQWLELDKDRFDPPQNKASDDTMLKIALILKEDPKLDEHAVKKLLQAWRPMYELYCEA
ncbi:MAG: helix-turn-helix transcriptional regulator [Deinococcales bacterium]